MLKKAGEGGGVGKAKLVGYSFDASVLAKKPYGALVALFGEIGGKRYARFFLEAVA